MWRCGRLSVGARYFNWKESIWSIDSELQLQAALSAIFKQLLCIKSEVRILYQTLVGMILGTYHTSVTAQQIFTKLIGLFQTGNWNLHTGFRLDWWSNDKIMTLKGLACVVYSTRVVYVAPKSKLGEIIKWTGETRIKWEMRLAKSESIENR